MRVILSFLILSLLNCQKSFSFEVGDKAMNFSLSSHTGKKIDLESFKGKIVVLEWYNSGCPFVRKFYDSKKMQTLQREFKDQTVWLTISSSARGKQGYIDSVDSAQKVRQREGMDSDYLLLDSSGDVGKLYGAKTTPHFFIINPKGILVYEGAIDSIASADSHDIKIAKNYVELALKEILAKKQVTISRTKAYGCSVKY